MDSKTRLKILAYQDYLGFPLRRLTTKPGSKEPHDETFSYKLCLRFYGKRAEAKYAIREGNEIIVMLSDEFKKTTDPLIQKYLAVFYSLLGNLFYIEERYGESTGYFMKCLSIERTDITPWIELLFTLREMGDFSLFERAIFNLDMLTIAWSKSKEQELTQEIVVELINLVLQNTDQAQLLLKQELLKEYKRNQIDFISLLRLLHGKKTCGRINCNLETARRWETILDSRGFHSIILPRAVTRAANPGDERVDKDIMIDLLLKDPKFKRLNSIYSLLKQERDWLKETIDKNIRSNKYRFYDRDMQLGWYGSNPYFLYFGKTQEHLLKVIKSELTGNSDPFDYPECCTRSYSGGDNHFYNICRAGPRTIIASHLLNFLPFVHPLLEYYPCSYGCKKSLEIAKETMEVLKEFDPILAEKTENELKGLYFVAESFIVLFEKKIEPYIEQGREIKNTDFKIWSPPSRVESARLEEGRIILTKETGQEKMIYEGYLIRFE